MDEDKITDSEWLKLQRLESDRRAWLWSRLRSAGGWIVGTLTAMWAGVDAVAKFLDWIKK